MSRTLSFFGRDVFVVIAALGVGHDGKFQVGRVVADDAAQVFLEAVFPAAVFAGLDAFARRLVAEFHVINARRDARVIDHLHDLVVEVVVVHQAAVADGAIEDFDFGPEREPAAGGGIFGFGMSSSWMNASDDRANFLKNPLMTSATRWICASVNSG